MVFHFLCCNMAVHDCKVFRMADKSSRCLLCVRQLDWRVQLCASFCLRFFGLTEARRQPRDRDLAQDICAACGGFISLFSISVSEGRQ